MSLVTKQQLKSHMNLTSSDTEFDSQLPRFLGAAESKVLAYLNRNVLTELPDPLENETDIALESAIEVAILDIAAYYFDAKGNVDDGLIVSMLNAYIGHLRIPVSS